jgi:hypothetical protein
LELGSNVTVEREVQQSKQFEPMILTEAGMQIDWSKVQDENASFPIWLSLE